jgi:hypothetical protein
MLIDNLDKIIGLVGLIMGMELIAIVIFTASIVYFRNPVVAGLMGNFSFLTMGLGLVGFSVNHEKKEAVKLLGVNNLKKKNSINL